MPNEYRAGPVFRAGLIVSGGMCAGLGIAILMALALHRVTYASLLPDSVPTPPVSAVGFVACGLALIGVGCWFPRVTLLLAMVTVSMATSLAAERILGLGPRVENLVAASLGGGTWRAIAPNTLVVLVLAAAALLLRHAHQFFETRLGTIAVLGSIVFAIGAVGCVGYMTGVPTYAWNGEPMSFLSALCSCVMGLGIVMSACRYSEMNESGTPRWFGLVVCSGTLAINVSTAVAYLWRDGHTWGRVAGLMPMMIVSGILSVVAARQAQKSASSGRELFPATAPAPGVPGFRASI